MEEEKTFYIEVDLPNLLLNSNIETFTQTIIFEWLKVITERAIEIEDEVILSCLCKLRIIKGDKKTLKKLDKKLKKWELKK